MGNKSRLTETELNRELLNGSYYTNLRTNKGCTFTLALLMSIGSTIFLFIGRIARDVPVWPAFIPIALTSSWILAIAFSHHSTPAEDWENMMPDQCATWSIYHSKWGFLQISSLFFHSSFVIAWGAVELALSQSMRWAAILFGTTYLLWVLYCTLRSRWILHVALEGPTVHPVTYRLISVGFLLIGAIYTMRGFLHIWVINMPTAANLLVIPLLLAVYGMAIITYPFALTLAWRARLQWKHWAKIKDGIDSR